ncbi:MAG: Mce-associated rane protein [Mycobacterium sp.]|jgi:Mce-associated membrane protein|nr:Mce-associated rane protein [Mycobacterium sp.]
MASEAPSIEDVEETETAHKAERTSRVVRVPLSALVWGVAVLVSVGLLVGLGYFWWWPDRQTTDTVQQAVRDTAKDGVTAVYSYASDTIDRDIANAKSRLTGDMLTEYEKNASSGAVAAAKSKAVRATGVVTGAAVKQLRPDSADVLVFLNLTSATQDSPATQLGTGSLMVSLSKVDGKWLISAMQPA